MSPETIDPADVSVGEIDKQIADLQRQKRQMTTVQSKKEVEVTVVMAAYNAWRWLARSIFCIELGAQALPVDLIICDNTSTDPTGDILAGDGFKRWIEKRRGISEVEILDPIPQLEYEESGTPNNPIRKPFRSVEARRSRNLDFMWTKLTRHVKTPFILYLDADVGMPSGCIATMVQKLKEREKLAVVGVRYTWEAPLDHVQFGCTMAKTKLIKQIVDQFDSRKSGCPCRYATRQLKAAGYDVEHLDGWVARHFKHETP